MNTLTYEPSRNPHSNLVIKWLPRIAIGLAVLAAFILVTRYNWQGNAMVHTNMELVATLMAAACGLIAIVRYYSVKTNLMLFFSMAFLGTAFLDGYHTLVTTLFFKQFMPSDLPSLIPWSWVASRWYLSVILCACAYFWYRREEIDLTKKHREAIVFSLCITFTLFCFAFFAFYPLPQAYYPTFFIHRPEELIPAVMFAMALYGFIKIDNWRTCPIESWLIISLIISLITQLIYMPFSIRLFDHEFNVAHTLKIVSYAAVFIGLLKGIHSGIHQAIAGEERLRSTMDTVSEGILVVEPGGAICTINHSIEKMFGIPEKRLLGNDLTILFSASQTFSHGTRHRLKLSKQCLDTAKPNQIMNARRHDGSVFPVSLSAGEFQSPKGPMYVLSITDITQQLKNETAIREKSEELEKKTNTAFQMAEDLRQIKDLHQDAIQNISEGFVLWDSDDRLLMCNEVFKIAYSGISDIIETGVRFEDFITEAYRRKVLHVTSGSMKNAIRQRIRQHRGSITAFEEQVGKDRWFRVSEREASEDRIVGIVTDITERKNWAMSIKRLAETDTLTNLPNRFLFQERMQQALDQANRTKAAVAIMLLDLDKFKNVNDTLGHPIGDALLIEVARRIVDCARTTDTVARLGGDEFAVIATNLKSPLEVEVLAERIVHSLAEPFYLEDNIVYSGSSIGITIFPQDQGGPDELMKNADIALYRAKEEGRGVYRLFDEDMNAEIQMRQKTEAELRIAIENNQLFLAYQPQIDLRTGKIIGIEALIRWQHPIRGCLLPGEFIAVAESTNLIIPISEWILREACMLNKHLQANGLKEVTVSVNISPLHFNQSGLLQSVIDVLEASSLAPGFLELEITESLAMTHTDNIIQMLNQLKDIGVKLAIDDFGTGYSSLSRLKDFPVDRLKIDRSFVSDLSSEKGHQAISKAIIDLGHTLGLKVIAEGVELHEHITLLQALGCDEVQGYFIAKPLIESDLITFMQTHGDDALIQAAQVQAEEEYALAAS